MAIWEDALEGNLVMAAALGTGAILFTRISPELPPGVRSLAKSCLQLFVEAEFDLDEGDIDKLVKSTVGALLNNVDEPDGPGKTSDTSRILESFKRKAKERSHRRGWNQRDRSFRYQRHVVKLKRAMSQAARTLPSEQQAYVSELTDGISEQFPD